MNIRIALIAALIVGVALIIGGTGIASAQDTRPQDDPHWYETPRNFEFGFNFGLVIPFDQDIQDVYGDKGDAIYTLQAGWRMVHELTLHAEMSYYFFEGNGVSTTGKSTSEKYKLHVAPAELGLAYRFAFVPDQIVVPFIGAAGSYTYWFEERLDSSVKNRGLLGGLTGQAGLMFLLDDIEPRTSGRLEGEWGINNTYFFYQFKYFWLNDFGDDTKKLDLSAQGHTLGVLFQF